MFIKGLLKWMVLVTGAIKHTGVLRSYARSFLIVNKISSELALVLDFSILFFDSPLKTITQNQLKFVSLFYLVYLLEKKNAPVINKTKFFYTRQIFFWLLNSSLSFWSIKFAFIFFISLYLSQNNQNNFFIIA